MHCFGQRPGVTFGFPLCRGNQQSRWLVEGGYDWLAQRLFPRVRAERLLPRLALSPQCGFATSTLGNALTAADEEAKLRIIVATAERVWGMMVLTVSNSMLGRSLLCHRILMQAPTRSTQNDRPRRERTSRPPTQPA